MKKLLTTVLFLGVLGNGLSVVWAQRRPSEIESLRGLKGVGVKVENVAHDTEVTGLRTSQIRADVELELRKAGIRVYESKEELLRIPGLPLLVVGVETRSFGVGFFYILRLEFVQYVTLSRKKQISLMARTWHRMGQGAVESSKVQGIRENLRNFINSFISDFLAVNPK